VKTTPSVNKQQYLRIWKWCFWSHDLGNLNSSSKQFFYRIPFIFFLLLLMKLWKKM